MARKSNRIINIFTFISLVFCTATIYKAKASEGTWINITPPNTNYFGAIEIADWTILAGEFDQRIFKNPYNGIFYTTDLGATWKQLGLQSHGVTNLKWHDESLYATTYYKVDGHVGLYVSNDKGESFTPIGPTFSASAFEIGNGVMLLGGYSHGLWKSSDEGNTWLQIFGDGSGVTGPKINSIQYINDIFFASINSDTYISKDNGATWVKSLDLEGMHIHNFVLFKGKIYGASTQLSRVFYSVDNGNTWVELKSWAFSTPGCMQVLNNKLYVGGSYAGNITVLEYDGNTWTDTNLNAISDSNCSSMKTYYAGKHHGIITLPFAGIYTYTPNTADNSSPFLNLPWSYNNAAELTDRVTSYFDHTYPLLGYTAHKEPKEHQTTITSYTGETSAPPSMYYSSHNGVDFRLPFGTPVLAAQRGIAKYYYCAACGHTIKIDHLNGYETVYMHLQIDELITLDIEKGVEVNVGDVIGKVGVTGHTTGPHLHFGVQDALKPYPSSLIDPFGWSSKIYLDPWERYAWADVYGNHYGSASKYMWNIPSAQQEIFTGVNSSVKSGNKNVTFNSSEKSSLLTLSIQNFFRPFLSSAHSYIENTSTQIAAIDLLGKEISQLTQPAKISFDLSEASLSNVVLNSIKVYYWSNELIRWEPLESVLDVSNLYISALTDHFSNFAVFGELVNALVPETTISLEPNEPYWLTEYPSIKLNTNLAGTELTQVTYYSVNNGLDWNVYSQPFYLYQNGISNVLYFSEFDNGNVEEQSNLVVRVNTEGKWVDQSSIGGASFAIK